MSKKMLVPLIKINLIKIHMPVTSMIIRGVEKNEGHSVDDMQMMIWGVCKDCKNKED